MLNEISKKYKLQENLLTLIGMITFIVANICFFSKQYIFATKIIDLVLIMFTGSLIILCNNVVNKKKNDFSDFLGMSSILVLSIKMVFFLIPYNFYKDNFFISLILIMLILKLTTEYLIVILSVFYAKKKMNYKKVNKINIYICIILILIIVTISKKFKLYYLESIIGSLKYLIILLNIFLYIISMILIKYNKKLIENNIYIVTKIYLSLIFWGQLIFFLSMYNLKSVFLISSYSLKLIKFIAFYLLYREILCLVLNKSFEEVKEKIVKSEEKFTKSNNLLKKKASTLMELKNLTETGEDSYEKLIKSIEDSIFIFKDGKLEYINDIAMNLLGMEENTDYLNKSFDEIFSLVLALEIKTVNDIKYCNNDYYREVVLKSPIGRFIDVELYVLPFEKDSRLLLIRDVTVINRTRKVNGFLEKYFQEEHVKRDFFSNISHELRTPINVIFSALQLNDIYIIKNEVKLIEKNNKMIKQNCLRLIRTINNFIDANKISEGFISPDFHVFNVVEVVENIVQVASKYMNKAGLDLIFDSEREEIFIELDKVFLERVVLNILSNSIKYKRRNGKILVNILIENNNIVIIIENDGNMISGEELQYMFEKFSKNNMAFNRTQEGSGLGLYISRSLMELQGGSLIVEVEEQKGNRFIITYNNVRLFNEVEDFETYVSPLNEMMEKVDIEFSDITI